MPRALSLAPLFLRRPPALWPSAPTPPSCISLPPMLHDAAAFLCLYAALLRRGRARFRPSPPHHIRHGRRELSSNTLSWSVPVGSYKIGGGGYGRTLYPLAGRVWGQGGGARVGIVVQNHTQTQMVPSGMGPRELHSLLAFLHRSTDFTRTHEIPLSSVSFK